MTKEKWYKVFKEEIQKTVYFEMTPETWVDEYRAKVVNLIEEMDKATEVYNLENKK